MTQGDNIHLWTTSDNFHEWLVNIVWKEGGDTVHYDTMNLGKVRYVHIELNQDNSRTSG